MVRIGRFGLVGVVRLLEVFLIVFHAFRYVICVRIIEVIIFSHLSFFCSAISSISLFTASMVRRLMGYIDTVLGMLRIMSSIRL